MLTRRLTSLDLSTFIKIIPVIIVEDLYSFLPFLSIGIDTALGVCIACQQ